MTGWNKPRGYFWTCASTFQRRDDYHEFPLDAGDDLTSAVGLQTRTYDIDPDHQLSPSGRAKKRRRIGQLANDFLNGTPLSIASARSNGRATQEVVHAADAACTSWQDVQDEWEYLRAVNKARASRRRTEDGLRTSEADVATGTAEQHIAIDRAQSTCLADTRSNRCQVFSGPSGEALRLAGELRDRGFRKVLNDECINPLRISLRQGLQKSLTSAAMTNSSIPSPAPTAAWTSSKWLKTGAFVPRQKTVDEDCSRDELGAASFASTFQRAPYRAHTAEPACGGSSGVSILIQSSARAMSEPARDDQATSFCTEFDGLKSTGPPFRTSGTDQPFDVNPSGPVSGFRAEGDLKGLGICIIPRKSWSSINADTDLDVADESVHGSSTDEKKLRPTIRAATHETALSFAEKPKKGRRPQSDDPMSTKGTTRASQRRKSAPAESQPASKALAGVPPSQRRRKSMFRLQCNAAAGNDSSPFIFRKRVSKSPNSGDSGIEAITSIHQTPRMLCDKSTTNSSGIVGTHVYPSLDRMKDATTTPMVDQHLNQILPRSGINGKATASVKRLLREELVKSGAEMTRAADLAASSQMSSTQSISRPADAQVCDPDIAMRNNIRKIESPLWPGTQAALAHAQQNLFDSPESTNLTIFPGQRSFQGSATSSSHGPQNSATKHDHLRSQVPSTQALLDGWQGWSTIKKPRAPLKRSSLVQPPRFGRGEIASDSVVASKEAHHQMSSLPSATYLSLERPPCHPLQSATSSKINVDDSFLVPGLTGTEESICSSKQVSLATVSECSRTVLLPSFQAAQDEDEDCQAPLRLVTQLTGDVVGTDYSTIF